MVNFGINACAYAYRFKTVAFALVIVENVIIWADLRNAAAVAGSVTVLSLCVVVEVLVGTASLCVAEAISEIAIIVLVCWTNNSFENASSV
jgi:hypothetical protein